MFILKKLTAALCAGAIALSAVSFVHSDIPAAYAASPDPCVSYNGNNLGAQNYDGNWSSVVQSYLTAESSGKLMRVQGDAVSGKILVEYYDSSFNIESRKLVNAELPVFGAFYSDGSNYYILSGQNNKNQNNSVEVFRITKYDKNWNKLGACGLKGANTTVPFDAGSARMTHDGKYLFIRTCHEMYLRNGVHHQANVTIQVDTSAMKITDSYTDVMNVDYGYVSHSFNQFIKTDGGRLVTVDHGDANPRAIILQKYPTSYSSGKFVPDYYHPCQTNELISLPGADGENYTGVTLGGFEVSSSAYLLAGTYNKYTGSVDNVFISCQPKSMGTPSLKWVTSYTKSSDSASTPQFVKISDSRFVVFWQSGSKVYYNEIDANGNKVGSSYSMNASLSDCAPIISGGKIIWYTWNNGDVTFYTVNTSDISKNSSKKVTSGHVYTTKNATASNGTVTQTCQVCGHVEKFTTSTSFDAWWRLNADSGVYYSDVDSALKTGDKLDIWADLNDSPDCTDIVMEISDTSVASFDKNGYENMRRLTPKKAGSFTVKIYPRYNPSIAVSKTFTVTGSQITVPDPDPDPTPTPAPSVPKTSMTKFTSTTNAIRVNWNAVSGAAGYVVSMNDGSGWKDIAEVSSSETTYRKSGLSAGKVYTFRVKAYKMQNGSRYYGNNSADLSAATKPSKVNITKASKSSSAVRLYWNKVNCSGYKIQKYNNSTKKWETVKLISSSKDNYRISGLKKNTAYKFRIQAYTKAGSSKAYSTWSDTKKATTKK